MDINTDALLAKIDLVQLVNAPLQRVASTLGGEFSGPCPFCGGHDRFCVWPNHPCGRGRFWCRRCDRKGDAIQFLRERDGLSFHEAVRELGGYLPVRIEQWAPRVDRAAPLPVATHPPCPTWQARGRQLADKAEEALWAGENWALDELRRRGLDDDTIHRAGLGLNPTSWRDDPGRWGLDGKPVWLPRGIVIPWRADRELWRLNIRRPAGDLEGKKSPKYIGPRGWGGGNPIYGIGAVGRDRPVVMVEGELDALTVAQVAGHLVDAVATGSTDGGRRVRWISRLAMAPVVLIAFDADQAGDQAAGWWAGVLPNGLRWRPYYGDANAMHVGGIDVQEWITAGLLYFAELTGRPVMRDGVSTRADT